MTDFTDKLDKALAEYRNKVLSDLMDMEADNDRNPSDRPEQNLKQAILQLIEEEVDTVIKKITPIRHFGDKPRYWHEGFNSAVDVVWSNYGRLRAEQRKTLRGGE